MACAGRARSPARITTSASLRGNGSPPCDRCRSERMFSFMGSHLDHSAIYKDIPRPARRMAKADYEKLADFRYRLRRFLRFSEDATRKRGVPLLKYLLMRRIGGFLGRDWATVGELAERLQAKHHGVVSLVSRCEALGLVRRSISNSDRRRVEVQLTRKGDERLEQLAHLHRVELLSLQGAFAVPDLAAFGRA